MFTGDAPSADSVAVSAGAHERVPGCDLSTTCWHCGATMRPEHAHYRCTGCGQRDSCCDGPY